MMRKFIVTLLSLTIMIASIVTPCFAVSNEAEINGENDLMLENCETDLTDLLIGGSSFTHAGETATNLGFNYDRSVTTGTSLRDTFTTTVEPVFVQQKLALAQEKLHDYELPLKVNGVTEKFLNLGDGCYIKITVTDCAETGNLTFRGTSPGAETLWKNYGDRLSTAKYEIYLLALYYELTLANHYTLSQNGITVRYGESWVDYSGIATGSAASVNITQSSAQIGQTVSMNCVFTLGQSTVPQFSKIFKMYNKVKCSAIDTTGRQVKVVQSWNGNWLT